MRTPGVVDTVPVTSRSSALRRRATGPLLLIVLALTATMLAAPAEAKTRLGQVTGLKRQADHSSDQDWASRSRRMTWKRVKGASRYDVQVSRSSSFRARGTTTERVKGTRAWARHLAAGVTYKVRVRAVRSRAKGPWSRTATVTFDAGRNLGGIRVSTSSVTGGVRLGWNAVDYATRYEVLSGTDASDLDRKQTLGGGVRSLVLRGSASAGTSQPYGNPTYARVYGRSAKKYRASPVLAALPAPARPDTARRTVAGVGTYNVAWSAGDWSERSERIGKQIRAQVGAGSGLGVVLLQEATASAAAAVVRQLPGWKAFGTYASGNSVIYDGTRYTGPSGELPKDATAATGGTLPVVGTVPATWARLTDRRTGGRAVVVSAHLRSSDSVSGRRASASSLLQELRSAGLDDGATPLVVAGDLIDDSRAGTAQRAFVQNGFYDAAAAGPSLSNRGYHTFNGWKKQTASRYGFGVRSDYLLIKSSPGSRSYRNAPWRSNGKPPSDHNLVWAELGLTTK